MSDSPSSVSSHSQIYFVANLVSGDAKLRSEDGNDKDYGYGERCAIVMITGEFRQLSTDISDTGIWLAFPSPFNFSTDML